MREILQPHRSFRLTKPEYMRGKRVKPRLRILAIVTWLISYAGSLLILAASWMAFVGFGAGVQGQVILVLSLLCIGFAIAIAYLVPFIMKPVFVKLGILTLDEARAFPPGREFWPESWLEPIASRDSDLACDTHDNEDE